MEFQMEQDPPHMRSTPENAGPKRGFTGQGPRLTAPIDRSSHVLSFANHGGRFRNVNMSIRSDKQTPNRDKYTRYFPRKKNEGQQNRTAHKHQHKEFVPAPPKLKRAIQLMYKLLKLTHHMSRATTKIEGNQPMTFKRLTSLLTNTIRPAFPNDRVTQMIRGSAQN
ncbi:hypothetical protein ABG768_018869 [Culter alburnus]|uniref:Uncharacterized protein n=1 Tax=Culter alburnus TaxID=194366 RepID=A0AAW2AVJ7_CULAL